MTTHKGGAKADEETRADEHAQVLGSGLDDGGDEDERAAKEDTSLATVDVGNVRRKRRSCERAVGCLAGVKLKFRGAHPMDWIALNRPSALESG
jgi:hypothetical protein